VNPADCRGDTDCHLRRTPLRTAGRRTTRQVLVLSSDAQCDPSLAQPMPSLMSTPSINQRSHPCACCVRFVCCCVLPSPPAPSRCVRSQARRLPPKLAKDRVSYSASVGGRKGLITIGRHAIGERGSGTTTVGDATVVGIAIGGVVGGTAAAMRGTATGAAGGVGTIVATIAGATIDAGDGTIDVSGASVAAGRSAGGSDQCVDDAGRSRVHHASTCIVLAPNVRHVCCLGVEDRKGSGSKQRVALRNFRGCDSPSSSLFSQSLPSPTPR
jgi:hypothetical protein